MAGSSCSAGLDDLRDILQAPELAMDWLAV